jgi:hypothetical protein
MGFLEKLFGWPSLDQFAAELIHALHEAGDRGDLRYDSPDHRILLFRDGETAGVVNLGNM